MKRFNVYAVIEVEAKDVDDAIGFVTAASDDVSVGLDKEGVREITVRRIAEQVVEGGTEE